MFSFWPVLTLLEPLPFFVGVGCCVSSGLGNDVSLLL
jgi:hypothetical protein